MCEVLYRAMVRIALPSLIVYDPLRGSLVFVFLIRDHLTIASEPYCATTWDPI